MRAALLLVLPLAACRDEPPPEPPDSPGAEAAQGHAGSGRCATCHREQHALWVSSQHARAERELDAALDGPAFGPGHEVAHGSQVSRAREVDGRYELVTQGPEGEQVAFAVARAFAVEPLVQYLIEVDPGRFQVSELAWDPAAGEWFDVFGDEDRGAGEWGHWTGRGMTWNGRCAQCHNTGVEKGYDFERDRYDTRVAEMGVGCEACHGPMAAHVEWQEERREGPARDPHLANRTPARWMDACGNCHARRAELTSAFVPGEAFLDHFLPTIPDDTDLYHPDGQVRDEDFEFVSFLSSRMWGEGVTCLDCHEPHSGRTRLQGNDLCLRCHGETIVPDQHMFHEPGAPGGRCVDCHMPETTYMQRDPRRDHGFTIPDPWLTLEHGTPNACNRCHTDRDAAWALAAAEDWWGERLDRGTRHRADAVARVRAGEEAGVSDLFFLLSPDGQPLWRAVAVTLLAGWVHRDDVREALLWRTGDPDPLVRAQAAIALAPLAGIGRAEVDMALRELLRDPVRAVRIQAAWALRDEVPVSSPAGRDLEVSLHHGLDDVAGAHRMGVYQADRRELDGDLRYLRRAVEWDPHTPFLRRDLALVLGLMGRPEEAAVELEGAIELAPDESVLWFQLGQARYEAAQLDEAEGAFRHAADLTPDFARVWYNLGLLEKERGRPEDALRSLLIAESKDPADPDPSYAAGLLLLELERPEEAVSALRRALARAPGHAGARRALSGLTGEQDG